MTMKLLACQVFFLLLLILPTSLVGAFTQGSANEEEDEGTPQLVDDGGFRELVQWMRSHGGRVDQRMAIGFVQGIRGVVTTANIEEGAELLHCPWKLVIGSSGLDNQMETEPDMCNVVKIMAAEYRKGPKSMGWPYLNHIELPRLPAQWNADAVSELQGLPPSKEVGRHLQWFSQNCDGGTNLDQATMWSLVSFISRASAVGMVPIYDLLNHHNGLKNAKLFLTEEGVDLRTIQPVQEHQQLYLSYGVKTSSHMYRDYGFVEAWPSLWSWRDASTHDNHVFALLPDGFAAIHPTADFLKEIWKGPPSPTPNPNPSLQEYQQKVIRFNQSLKTEALSRFREAAERFLEGLPTTWQQDVAILKQKEEKSNNSLGGEDIQAAIQYRLTFKRAVSEALNACIDLLESRDEL